MYGEHMKWQSNQRGARPNPYHSGSNVRRRAAAAAALALIMAGSVVASGRDDSDTPAPRTVVVHVSNGMNLSPDDLRRSEDQATAVYRSAGLDLVWTAAPLPQRTEARIPPAAVDVRLVVASREMAENMIRSQESKLKPGALGFALSASTEPQARIAYVFSDHIAELALRYQTSVTRAIARMMAHEVGHLLLGVNSHARTGLMQAGWSPRDNRLETFTASEVQAIRRRFSAM